MASAAVAIVRGNGSHVLAVSRKDNPCDFGFPGGGREPGESIEACCLRELTKETGYVGEIVRHVYTGPAGEMPCSAFEVRIVGSVDRGAGETGGVRWVNEATVIAGSFGEFNREVLRLLAL